MKIRYLLPAIAYILLTICPATAADFTINDFDAFISVSKDSSFTVKESLTVRFERPRHGIYRDIPYIYRDSFGKTVRTPLDIISVTDSAGKNLRHKVTRQGSIVRVRIGDPDTYVSGIQKYEIFYKVENAVLFFDDHDELYWNVTGNEWEASIKKASATVALQGLESKDFRASCYTGKAGSTDAECSYTKTAGSAEFFSKKSFQPGEGLTIAYGWDKGLVSPPSALKRFLWAVNLRQNWVFVLPLISLIIMLNLYLATGRDPSVRQAVTVMYGPPESNKTALTPAEVGTLLDETVDQRDITAGIVNLAVRGYIKIEETKEEGLIFDRKDYYLRKIKDSDSNLPPIEIRLMSDIFGTSQGKLISDLRNSFYKKIPGLKSSIYSSLIIKKYFTTNPETVRAAYLIAGVLAGAITAAILSYFLSDAIEGYRAVLAGILTGLPMTGFAKFMPAKTKEGAAAYMHLLGFREFMERAEKDQLERMKDQNLFSKFFPYALALNVADNWAKAFEGIYQEQPDWYVSSSGMRTFNPVVFNHSFNSAVSDLSSAIYSAPRGSGAGGGGSFGGGSSGGGFGGGGGGSW